MKVIDSLINGEIIYREQTNYEKLSDLKTWFDSYYSQHEQKYRRLHTLNLLCDDGSLPIEKLTQLYEEAEFKRHEIQELEKAGETNGFIY